jgi:hypothetical protein
MLLLGYIPLRFHFSLPPSDSLCLIRHALQVARVLVAASADVNACELRSHTPLHMAAAGGHVQVLQLLLGAGASHAARDHEDYQPLAVAAAEGQVPAMQVRMRVCSAKRCFGGKLCGCTAIACCTATVLLQKHKGDQHD